MAVVWDHNKVDPQPPTKRGGDQPAPVFFPALLHRRVSHSNHFYLPLIPFPYFPHFYPQSYPWSSPYQMGRSKRSERDRKVQPPRPPNAWILYRSSKCGLIRQAAERMSQASVSKIISNMWRNESEDVRRRFEREAEAKKAEHQALYPDYRFCPKKKAAKSRKKSKARETTPSDMDDDDDDDDDDDALPPMPALRPMSVHQPQPQPQPYPIPGYQPMPQPFMIPYLPEARYGPGGPSPPMSAAPSPVPYECSRSPLHPHLEQFVASSSSSPSTRLSPSSESQASSSSSQLPANPMYFPSLPNSHQPSPNPYATQPLSTLLFQTPTPGELPRISPRIQLQSPENTVAPIWNNISAQLPSPASQNSEEVINFDITINQAQSIPEFQQALSSRSSFDSLQGLLSRTDENGVFNLSNIDSSDLLAQPQGDLEVAMGPQVSTVDYYEELFADFDFVEFQRQMDSLREGGSSTAPIASSASVQDDLHSLFRTPNNPEVQAYRTAQQRQPSVFTQDMMHFLNFEAAEDSAEDTSAAVSPAPVPTTVAPQQVRLQSPQAAAAMPIFTQMTNTPTVASGATTSYVPPAGAICSSTRRVAGSWKPSFTVPPSQTEETVQPWNL